MVRAEWATGENIGEGRGEWARGRVVRISVGVQKNSGEGRKEY